MTDPDSDPDPLHDNELDDEFTEPEDSEEIDWDEAIDDENVPDSEDNDPEADEGRVAVDWQETLNEAGDKVSDGLRFLGESFQAGMFVIAATLVGTRLFPKSEKLWVGVAKLALKKIKKTTGADMIGFLSSEGGQLTPTPMKLKQRDEDDSKYWATTENDTEYDVGPQGVSREYIGSVPVGFFVDDPPREVNLLEARVRDAVDVGQHQPLVDGKVTLHEHVWQPSGSLEGGEHDGAAGAARADGGHAQAGMEEVFDREVEIDAEQIPDDSIIDLSTDSGNGARVSWNRVNDILHETPPTEQMVMQEQRGELAGAAGNEDKVTRIAIYALGFMVLLVFGLLFGPAIINAIFGNGTINGLGGALPTIGG